MDIHEEIARQIVARWPNTPPADLFIACAHVQGMLLVGQPEDAQWCQAKRSSEYMLSVAHFSAQDAS